MRLICLVLALVPLLAAAAPKAPKAPDIVIFLSDGHGQQDSSLYGNPEVRTPEMERLAGDGMTFSRAYSGSPSSVPARAVLMTGLMPARNGAVANTLGIAGDVRTLPAILGRAGYRCVRIGMDDLQPPTSYLDFETIPGEQAAAEKNQLVPEVLEAFLANRPRDDSRPLLVLVSSRRPAAPWPAATTIDPAAITLPPTQVPTAQAREARARYLSDVIRMDAELGKIYSAARAKLGENLLFIYTSTHGPQLPFAQDTLYDAAIRVPMIIAWPAHTPPGSRNPAMLNHADLTATLLDVAKAKAPTDLDGRSFAKLLEAGGPTTHRDTLFATHTADGASNVYPIRGLRTETHKFIMNLHPEFLFTTSLDAAPGGQNPLWQSWVAAAALDPAAAARVHAYQVRPPLELYDLSKDPFELNNLATRPEHRETLDKLRSRLLAWMVGQGDRRSVVGQAQLIPRAAPVGPRAKTPGAP
jgi:N-sulfoglucosamine sulfohydrolase